MYSTHLIYIENKSRIDIYTTEEITPAQMQELANLNTRIYTAVQDDLLVTYILDYSRMIVDYEEVAIATSWDSFNAVLTDALVLGYSTRLPAYQPNTRIPTNPVKVWDALATFNTFNLDYGDYLTGKYNLFVYRWLLHDLRISIQEGCTGDMPNLGRCLPVVNGFVCRPAYDTANNALYALDGAKLCWHNYKYSTPEVQLLDFTSVADIETVSIHNEDNYVNGDALFSPSPDDTRWSFILTGYDLSKYTAILVLGGIMILPDEYGLLSNEQIYVDIDKFPFNKALPLRRMLEEESVSSAEIAYKVKPYHEQLKDEFNTELSTNSFILLVKTNRLYINRSKTLDSWKNYNTVNDFDRNNAILINSATGTIRNFHLDRLADRNELIIQNHENIYINCDSRNKTQVSFIEPDCRHHNFQDINHCTCTGLKILGDINE